MDWHLSLWCFARRRLITDRRQHRAAWLDSGRAQSFVRHIRHQAADLVPRAQKMRRFPIQFRAINAENRSFAPSQDHPLLSNDVGLRVPQTLCRHAFRGHDGQIEFPKLQAALGHFPKQCALQMQQLAGKLENAHALDRRQHFTHRQVRGHHRRRSPGLRPKGFSYGKNRRAGIEKDGLSRLD